MTARTRALAAAALALSLTLPGCCALAREMCDIEGTAPPRVTRDTPLGAVDFLVEAFRRRAPSDIYESLHPVFIEENGGFSASQFASGYDRYEPEFRADAERLAAARKDPPRMAGGDAWVRVHDGAGAEVMLVFRNRPGCRVLVDDDDVSDDITGELPPLSEVVGVEGDGLVFRQPLPLRGRGEFVDPAKVRRVEVYQDWLLVRVVTPRNVRFVDRMLEEMKGANR